MLCVTVATAASARTDLIRLIGATSRLLGDGFGGPPAFGCYVPLSMVQTEGQRMIPRDCRY